ncbi:unnamed protein product [Albugo candida]|uniref:Uncharacterized protein n=1 Tax=Albugo candida TaxID=65357 RepID=A0A024G1G7_9STRA|nr:unnamed protein product [Albugo candida]|eukprot:CCI40162.1 unnamed protein product [Albugo candida]
MSYLILLLNLGLLLNIRIFQHNRSFPILRYNQKAMFADCLQFRTDSRIIKLQQIDV